MKNYINKIFIFSLILLLANSCIAYKSLWISRIGGMEAEGFFIDKENNRIVLVNYLDQSEPHTHYSIQDKSGKLVKIFELGEKSGWIKISFNLVYAKGKNITGNIMRIGIKKQNLSKVDLEFLEGFFKFSYNKESNILGQTFSFPDNVTRYPSSQETFTNFCSKENQAPNCANIVKFSEGWQGPIREEYTTKEKSWRIIASPFAAAIDVITAPLYLIAFAAAGMGSNTTTTITPSSK